MAAQKGHKKAGGRQKGSLNVKTKEVLDAVQRVIELIQDKYLEKDIIQMQPAERMRFYTGLLEYVRPKLARTDLTTNGKDLNAGQQIIVKSEQEKKELEEFLNRE